MWSAKIVARILNSNHHIACLGPAVSGLALAVDRYPAANDGAFVSKIERYLGADAPMIAQAIGGWGMPVQLITNALGDDELGNAAVSALNRCNVSHNIVLRKNLTTPLEMDVCDRAGTRTWFVEQRWDIFNTINDADLEGIRTASLLYIDWYAAQPVVARALQIARESNVPVYLNVEFSPEIDAFHHLIPGTSFVQTWVNDDDTEVNACARAEAVRAAGAREALVTRGSLGALGVDAFGRCTQIDAPKIEVVGTIGAGALFSAGFIYAHATGRDFATALRFAVATASLKCTHLAPVATSVADVTRMVERGLVAT